MSLAAPKMIYGQARVAETRAWARYIKIARLAGFVAVLCSPFSLCVLLWTVPQGFSLLSAVLGVTFVTYFCVLLFNRLRRGDRFVKLLFTAGIAARLAAAAAYIWVGFFVYNADVDTFHYWSLGIQRMQQFSEAGWAAFPPPYSSSNLIANVCGIIMLVTGNALPTLSVIFAFVGLLGGYFFYRAFCVAFPQGNRGLYGLLVVLLPSLLYWSSAISKDALTQLFIGISAYGFARVIKNLDFWTILVCIIGVAGTAMVRPHIGAMLAFSVLVPFGLSLTRSGLMTTAAKLLLIPVFAAGTLFVVRQAGTFVGMESNDVQSGIERLDFQHRTINDLGGSSFSGGQSLTVRVVESPLLLFRPFPWEVHNVMASLSSLEGMGLLILFWRKRRECWALVRGWREAYAGFVLLFVLLSSVIFGATSSNFGLLVRQRIMLVPIVLMFLCAKQLTTTAVSVRGAAIQRYSWFRTRSPFPQLGR
jgi:hypothetical protein